jgi:YD repeat-containing protein
MLLILGHEFLVSGVRSRAKNGYLPSPALRLRRGVVALLAASLFVSGVSSAVNYEYDELGRLIKVTQDDGVITNYTLDAAGNRTVVATTSGGNLQFSAATYGVGESGPTATITATRTGGSNGIVGVTYVTSNGTATAGSDYTATTNSLSWANGDTANKTFTVAILEDGAVEGSETINLTLSAPTGGAILGSQATAALTITDNDVAPSGTIQFSAATYSVGEAGPTVTITATRASGSNGVVGVTYATSNGTATSGSDYTATTNTLSWANGDTANKTFTVTILEDGTVEGNETVNLALSLPTGGATLGSQTTAVLTITDNDAAPAGALQFSTSSYSVGEAGPTATITATRTSGSNGAVGVTYATSNGTATSGSDFTTTTSTLSWANGDTANKTFTVSILEDGSVEGSETVNLALSAPTGGATLGSPSTAVLTITDNDTSNTITISDISFSGTSFGETTTAYVTFTSGGDVSATSNCSGCLSGDIGDWIVPKSNFSNYQARAINSTCVNTGGVSLAFNQWLAMTLNPVWGVSIYAPDPSTTSETCSMTIQISAIANPAVILDSAVISFNLWTGL